MQIITWLDYVGVFVFAMSGVLAASEKHLDMFGGLIIAFVTALGGGTLRDVLLNVNIGWILNPIYIYIGIGGTLFALVFNRRAQHLRRVAFLFDSIGIGVFTVLGVQKALALEVPIVAVVIFGMITATFGGVIRDILCNEIPLIFRQEIYASACLAGAVLYVILYNAGVPEIANAAIAVSVIILIRTIAVVKKLRVPLINRRL